MIKFALTTVATATVIVLGLAIDRQSEPPPAVAHVQHRVPTVSATGWVEGATREIELRFQLAGRIKPFDIRAGARVKKGQQLMSIDDSTYRHSAALALAELEAARAALQKLLKGTRQELRNEAKSHLQAKQALLRNAERSLKRTQELRQEKIATQEQHDMDLARVEALRAEVSAARARHELTIAPPRTIDVTIARARIAAAAARQQQAQTQLKRTILRAPFDARVVKINRRIGELVSPADHQATLILVDTTRSRIRAFVEEIDAQRIKQGQAVAVTIDGMDAAQTGTVTELSPRLQRKALFTDRPAESFDTKVREIWIDLQPNQPELIVGLRVNVSINVERSTSSNREVGRIRAARRGDYVHRN